MRFGDPRGGPVARDGLHVSILLLRFAKAAIMLGLGIPEDVSILLLRFDTYVEGLEDRVEVPRFNPSFEILEKRLTELEQAMAQLMFQSFF